jgi:hypothetical protein
MRVSSRAPASGFENFLNACPNLGLVHEVAAPRGLLADPHRIQKVRLRSQSAAEDLARQLVGSLSLLGSDLRKLSLLLVSKSDLHKLSLGARGRSVKHQINRVVPQFDVKDFRKPGFSGLVDAEVRAVYFVTSKPETLEKQKPLPFMAEFSRRIAKTRRSGPDNYVVLCVTAQTGRSVLIAEHIRDIKRAGARPSVWVSPPSLHEGHGTALKHDRTTEYR